jgi:cobyrinic acid a,c-diamide synthase
MIAFMVAGTASGVGKSTVALALMAALNEHGLRVQPFKCGPDFIDAGHHSAICGRAAFNLDAWMMDVEANRNLFARACRDADAAVVEGVMGLFDGAGATEEGSTAQMAKLLRLPIILVLDAARSSRSIAAVLHGFASFDPSVNIAGVVLNGVAGEAHERLLREAIGATSMIPIVGCLPTDQAIAIPERHLGLHTADETHTTPELRRSFAEIARRHIDLQPLLTMHYDETMACAETSQQSMTSPRVRIGVARDRAFSFYYEDNFSLLREQGAELIFFSPLQDRALPENLDCIYLGGGYPELYADTLSSNTAMIAELCAFAETGKPIYAECGGMVYLGHTLSTSDGAKLPMANLLPVDFEMTAQLQCFGYAEAVLAADCTLGVAGTKLRGHSFHCSRSCTDSSAATAAYRVHYTLSGSEEWEGNRVNNVFASYLHVCFRSQPQLVANLVSYARLTRGQELVI